MATTGSGQRNRPQRTFPEINEDAEHLLGQMMFAIGQGAAGVHIHRQAVAKMRERYEPTTYAFVEKADWRRVWQQNSIYTLRYFEVIGRLGALYATNDGTTAITARHFEQARVVVEATYRAEISKNPDLAVEEVRGDICPFALSEAELTAGHEPSTPADRDDVLAKSKKRR